jgi:hypothetical protein
MVVEPAMRTAIRTVIGLLVDGEYEALASMTSGRRLSAKEIAAAVESYGRTLVAPPAAISRLTWSSSRYPAMAAGESRPSCRCGRSRRGARTSPWSFF